MRATSRSADGLLLPAAVTERISGVLPELADAVVGAITSEVPSYTDALDDSMGATIKLAVREALRGFLVLAGGERGVGQRSPRAPAVDGAYELGRGEARSGRTTDAILSAYRIGAQVSWREMSRQAVAAGLDAEHLGAFAERVFAYIDELSAASVAGHGDELASTGRVRQRLLERLAGHLLHRAPADVVAEAAAEADWAPPSTLTAVIVAESQVRPLLASMPASTLQAAEAPGLDDATALLVPDAHGRRRPSLIADVGARHGLVGPARPWLEVRRSYDRALRARRLGLDARGGVDTEAHLAELVLSADADALADLRAQVLAPLATLRPGSREKLTDTLRAWLLHQGRRDDVAAALFVHPQTVRYRMGQVREAYGDALDDPETVRRIIVALGPEPGAGSGTGSGTGAGAGAGSGSGSPQ